MGALCGSVANVEWWTSRSQYNKVVTQCQRLGYMFWDQDSSSNYVSPSKTVGLDAGLGSVDKCSFPLRNLFTRTETKPDNFNENDGSTYFFENKLFIGTKTLQGQPSKQSFEALRGDLTCDDSCPLYFEYLPYRGVNSPFFDKRWIAWPTNDGGVNGLGEGTDPALSFQYQPIGSWTLWEVVQDVTWATAMGHISDVVDVSTWDDNLLHISDASYQGAYLDQSVNTPWISTNKLENSFFASFIDSNAGAAGATISTTDRLQAYAALQAARCGTILNDAVFDEVSSTGAFKCYPEEDDNQILLNVASRQMQKESLAHAQCASFIGIIIVQWADLVICKTRWLSIRQQGMRNDVMNFALVFELILGALLCYITPIGTALGTRDLRVTHWFCAMPFSCIIFLYDEIRKYFMRETSSIITDKVTGRSIRNPGWLERFTYY